MHYICEVYICFTEQVFGSVYVPQVNIWGLSMPYISRVWGLSLPCTSIFGGISMPHRTILGTSMPQRSILGVDQYPTRQYVGCIELYSCPTSQFFRNAFALQVNVLGSIFAPPVNLFLLASPLNGEFLFIYFVFCFNVNFSSSCSFQLECKIYNIVSSGQLLVSVQQGPSNANRKDMKGLKKGEREN